MNRLIAGAIAAAGSLAIAGGFVATAASSSAASAAAHHPAVVHHVAKANNGPGDNSSYGSSAPAGPITAPPQGLASSSGPNSVIVSNVNINGLLTTGTALDTASTLTAFSKVSSVNAFASGGGDSVSLTGSQFSSTCRSETASASANTIGAVLTADGVLVHLPDHPTVNQTFPLDGGADGTLILNHQIAAPGGGVEVIAADLHFTGTTPAQDLLLGVSVCTSPGTLGNTVTVTNPGDQTSVALTPITPLQIMATDSDPGQTLTYSATGLPPGLTINPATGVISGTPTTTTGSPFSVTVTATDTTGASGSTTFSWTVTSPNVVTVTPSTLTVAATEGTAITPVTMSTTDTAVLTPINPFTFSIASGSLPTGLSINATTGTISGTPATGTSTGSPYTVTVRATDATGATAVSSTITITVAGP